MRRPGGMVALFVAIALVFAGCMETGDGGQDSNDETDKEGDSKACHEQEPPIPAHPDDHQVDSEQEIRCAGHYTILDEGDGAVWDVPQWDVGQWWLYERHEPNGTTGQLECRHEVEEEVLGAGTFREVAVYNMVIERSDCSGKLQEAFGSNRTQDSLTEFGRDVWAEGTDDGFINHRLVFPLRDGKSWSYMNAQERIVEVQVSHEPSYSYNPPPDVGPIPVGQGSVPPVQTGTVEAWHIHMQVTQELEMEYWYGVEEENILKEKWTMDVEGVGVIREGYLRSSGG